MTWYQYIARHQLTIGDEKRQPGEFVPEAGEWPNVDAYIRAGLLEEIPVPIGSIGRNAVQKVGWRPRGVPVDEPTFQQLRAAQKNPSVENPTGIKCYNCRTLNHLPDGFQEDVHWRCYLCGQAQTIEKAESMPAPGWDDGSATPSTAWMGFSQQDETARKVSEQ